jgi:creatinine amidohydrolase
MSVYNLDKMTWEDVSKLDKASSLLFLPLSPIEEHGPHLPLGTDFYGALEVSQMALDILEKESPELNYILYPGIPLGCADVTGDFPGTISIKGNTLMQVIYDILAAFARSGFRFIIIVNHHFDIVHMKAIYSAVGKTVKQFRIHVYEPLGAAFFAADNHSVSTSLDRFNVDLDKEAHAEFEETSFISYRYPELLKSLYRDLPPVYVNMVRQYLRGRTTFKKMGAIQGYVGTPSSATPEYGKIYLAEKSRLVADSALKLFRGDDLPLIGLKYRLAMKVVRL